METEKNANYIAYIVEYSCDGVELWLVYGGYAHMMHVSYLHRHGFQFNPDVYINT